MPEQEESFTVRDRRRFTTEGEVPAADAPADRPAEVAPDAQWAADADADQDEDAGDPALPQELPDVYSVLAMFLGELRSLAWIRMGLVANPITGQIERDLPEARVAIDTVSFIASQLEPVVPPEERLPLRALVSDLQINFVEQSKKQA